jgi:hypothetical protein
MNALIRADNDGLKGVDLALEQVYDHPQKP